MLKRFLLITLFASLAAAAGYGVQSKDNVVIPVNKTNPTDGKQMYVSYCAPCHGVDGRGNGPTAVALIVKPIDLTALARANGGKYPAIHVNSVLQFGSTLPAHGSADMPVWGPILGTMEHGNQQSRQLRIANLNSYLKSIQAK
jgi:mono/diheme cytochrome c family protein